MEETLAKLQERSDGIAADAAAKNQKLWEDLAGIADGLATYNQDQTA